MKVRKIPWRRKWQPTPVFLPGKSHGQRSLAGYSSWSHRRVGHDLVTKPQRYNEGQIWMSIKNHVGTSLVVQWLTLQVPNAGGPGFIPHQGTRAHMLQLQPAATAAKSLQSCPTLCDPIDGSPPGSPVPGILQARTLEWVAISFSNAWKWKVKGKSLSRVWLLATPWTAAFQAPPSMGFSRQEYWSGVPSPSPNYSLVQLN